MISKYLGRPLATWLFGSALYFILRASILTYVDVHNKPIPHKQPHPPSPFYYTKLHKLPLPLQKPKQSQPHSHSLMATATATHLQSHHCVSPKFPYLRNPNLTPRFSSLFPRKVRVLTFREKFRGRDPVYYSVRCFRKNNSEIEAISVDENENERPPFDLNLAVVLAGFAFEAYTSPPVNVFFFSNCLRIHIYIV